MERFGVDPSLIGDLAERRTAGASGLWLFRQAGLAIVLKIFHDITGHWVLALRALAAGFLINQSLTLALDIPGLAMSRWFGVTMGNFLLEHSFDAVRWNFFRFHLWSMPQMLISALCGACAALVIARTHRAQAMSMVVLFLTVMELLRTYEIVERWRWAAAMPATNQWPYGPLVNAIMLVPAVMAVGLWSAQRSSDSVSSR
jgi:hypothetical protein